MTKIFYARFADTVFSIKSKTWSHVLILGLSSCSWVFGPGSRDVILGPDSQVAGLMSWVPVYSVIITKCDKNLLQKVTSITKCGRHKKMPQLLQSEISTDDITLHLLNNPILHMIFL